MTSKRWKAVELEIARLLGGQRNPLSGINSKHTAGDVIHDSFYIEIKHGKTSPFTARGLDIFHKTLANADLENKVPILIYHPKGVLLDHSIVVIRLKFLVELLKLTGITCSESFQ